MYLVETQVDQWAALRSSDDVGCYVVCLISIGGQSRPEDCSQARLASRFSTAAQPLRKALRTSS